MYLVGECDQGALSRLRSELEELGDSVAVAEAAAQKAAGKAAVIDESDHGFFKVLGKGELPAFPIVVRARFVSSIAERKIKAAGGAVILSA